MCAMKRTTAASIQQKTQDAVDLLVLRLGPGAVDSVILLWWLHKYYSFFAGDVPIVGLDSFGTKNPRLPESLASSVRG